MIKYFTIKNFLSEEQCDELLKHSINNLKMEVGLVGVNKYNEKVRKSSVSFSDYDKNFPYLKKMLINQIREKIKVKGYTVNFEDQTYQFTKYDKGQYYNWHTDSSGDGGSRYCSVVIQLNDEYTGGELEMEDETNGEIISFEKGKGNLFVFLSCIKHRVTEVNEGIRYSLVNWFQLTPIQDFKKTLI